MRLDRDTVELVRDFLRARGRVVRIGLEPLPWQEDGGLFVAARLPGTTIRILVDPRREAGAEAVSLAADAAERERTDLVLTPAAGPDRMLAAWPGALAEATALDGQKSREGPG